MMTQVTRDALLSAGRTRKQLSSHVTTHQQGNACVTGRAGAPLTNKCSLDKGPAWLLVGRNPPFFSWPVTVLTPVQAERRGLTGRPSSPSPRPEEALIIAIQPHTKPFTPMTSEFLLGIRSKPLPNPRNHRYSADVHPKDSKGGEHKRKWAGAPAQQVKGEAKRQKWVRMSSPH